ncbi:hypothetical protein ACKRZS_001584 [Fusarium odoratissimum]
MTAASPSFQPACATKHDSLKVLIVGAGIRGLTAAIGLRDEGHKVTVFERSALAQETGAAMHIAPNCHGLLQRFNIFPEMLGANKTNGIVDFDHKGNVRMSKDLRQDNSKWPYAWVLCHRAHLHEALKEAATSQTRQGEPVVLATASPVEAVDVTSTTVTLADGSFFSLDLILGADGVSIRAREILGGVAIEDAATICALLPRNISKDNVEDRLRLYEQIRDDRAHRIQDYTRWAGRDLDDHADNRFDITKFSHYNFSYDAWEQFQGGIGQLAGNSSGTGSQTLTYSTVLSHVFSKVNIQLY